MSDRSVHERATRDQASRPDIMVVALASILDGVLMLLTLGGHVSTFRQKASLRAARRLSRRQWWD